MVPKITRGGVSFKGAFAYYLHDKDGAASHDRIEWAHTENMRTGDPAKAWKVMAYTARAHERLKEASGQSRAGRKLEKPVFAFSLAWHPEQTPTQEHMLQTAQKAIEVLGLSEHEQVIVAHKDEPQKHVHIIVNRVHPLTGLAGDIRNSKRKLSDFAREYEETDGHIYCGQRVENRKMRRQGKGSHYIDPVIAEAWRQSSNGRDFMAALQAKGYSLAQGYKRIVVLDPHGRAHNPARLLRIKARDLQERLRDLDVSRLPVAGRNGLKKKGERTAEPPAEDHAARLEAFEQLASMEVYALRKRHRQEVADITSPQRLHLQSAKERLAKYYKLAERKAELTALKERIRQASWWQRLLGVTRHAREQHRVQVQSYQSAHARYREKIHHVEQQQQKSLAELQARQAGETHELQTRIDHLRPGRLEPDAAHEQQKERLRGGLREAFFAATQGNSEQNVGNFEDGRLQPASPSYPPVHAPNHDRVQTDRSRRPDGRSRL